jgi:ribokinase
MNNSITVIGSSNTDMVIQLDRIPRPGETIIGGEFVSTAGGKGANQAVAAARAGGKVAFVARLGADMFGDRALQNLKCEGIDVTQVSRDSRAPSGVALIFVARNGENSIAVASGANAKLSPADVHRARDVIKSSSLLVMQLETPLATVEAAARLARKHSVRVILNPAPAVPLPQALLRNVSILTPNETEAELLTGIRVNSRKAATRAAAELHSRGVETVIITLGERGAFVSGEGLMATLPGFRVKAVDTTAAGDIFNGALAVALSERLPLLQSVNFANAAAAISVTRLGAQPSVPHRSEIDRFLRQH